MNRPGGTAKPVSQQYVEAVNAADLDAVMALFADDAVLQHPMGVFTDPAGMAGFYRDVVFAGKAVTEIVTSARDGGYEWPEIEATSRLADTDEKVHAADLFEIDDAGDIVRLAIYYR